MNAITRRLISKAIEQVAGSGCGVDANGRLYYPDGLEPDRVHRFIELVMAESFESPRSALHALFESVGVPTPAIEALDVVLRDDGAIDLSAVARSPVQLAASLPSVRLIPDYFRRFLVDGLGFADAYDVTLEQAAISTRKGVAAAIGCEASWDAILDESDAVSELARPWRETTLPGGA